MRSEEERRSNAAYNDRLEELAQRFGPPPNSLLRHFLPEREMIEQARQAGPQLSLQELYMQYGVWRPIRNLNDSYSYTIIRLGTPDPFIIGVWQESRLCQVVHLRRGLRLQVLRLAP